MSETKTVKSAVLAVARMENPYLVEWVTYHLNLGFNHVFVCDNNFEGEEDISSFLDEHLETFLRERVTVFNHHNDATVYRQMRYYSNYVRMYKDEYDWIACIDVDEFVTFAGDSGFNNVNDFLSQDIFDNAGQILLNWMMYGDNNLLEADTTTGVQERFTKPAVLNCGQNDNPNRHVKSIVNCRMLTSPPVFTNPHCMRCANSVRPNGVKCENTPFHIPDFSVAYIRHYYTKTMTEFLNKVIRGRADNGNATKTALPVLMNYLKVFLQLNEMNDEKRKIFMSFLVSNYTEDEIAKAISQIG